MGPAQRRPGELLEPRLLELVARATLTRSNPTEAARHRAEHAGRARSTSAGRRALTQGKYDADLIPDSLRRALGVPTFEQQEAQRLEMEKLRQAR
jgi:hypothetical protein